MKRAVRLVVVLVLLTVVTVLGGGVSRADDDVPPILSPLDTGGIQHAVRLDPPDPVMPVLWTSDSWNGRCVGLEGALAYWSPGWDVTRMAAIAYRESRCDPDASNSCCSGVLQIHRSWVDNVAMCGIDARADLYDPWKNVCAAAVVYRTQGIGAWSTS